MPTISRKSPVNVTKSRGNVFADLGFPEPELMKAKLVLRLRELIAEQKLTQTKAAELLGIDQPKISGLLRGRVTGYTLDRLAKLVTRLGQPIDLIFHPMSPSAPRPLPVRKKPRVSSSLLCKNRARLQPPLREGNRQSHIYRSVGTSWRIGRSCVSRGFPCRGCSGNCRAERYCLSPFLPPHAPTSSPYSFVNFSRMAALLNRVR